MRYTVCCDAHTKKGWANFYLLEWEEDRFTSRDFMTFVVGRVEHIIQGNDEIVWFDSKEEASVAVREIAMWAAAEERPMRSVWIATEDEYDVDLIVGIAAPSVDVSELDPR